MEDKLTAGERTAIQVWAVWYLDRHQGRKLVEEWAGWYLRELVAELEDVARTKGRDIDIPRPLFFADLLEALEALEVDPAEFFRAVLQRWSRAEA